MVGSVMAAEVAGRGRRGARPVVAAPQTHCEPCGAPLEGPACSYCKTAAKAWRGQREPQVMDLADVEVRVADLYGVASMRPEWSGGMK
jgi:hypothetical protein